MSGEFLALILTALLSISVQCLQIREYEKPPTIGPPPNEIEIDYEERQYCSNIVRILGQILEKLLGITTNATRFCNKRSWIQDRSISDEPRGVSLNQWNRRDWWKRWLFWRPCWGEGLEFFSGSSCLVAGVPRTVRFNSLPIISKQNFYCFLFPDELFSKSIKGC